MNRYIVFLKQVPASTKIKMDPKTKTLLRQSSACRTNPDDLYALEVALWAKRQTGGEIIAVTMGPESAVSTLHEALQRGADRAILVSDRAFAGSDTLCTSYVLSSVVKKIGDYSALFFGRMAIDGDTAQVGPEVAAHLDIPQITSLSHIASIDNTNIEVLKKQGNLTQSLLIKLPCAMMVSKNCGKISSPTLKGWQKAQKIEIERENAETLGIDPQKVGLEASPTRVVDTYVPENNKKVTILDSISKLLQTITNSTTI